MKRKADQPIEKSKRGAGRLVFMHVSAPLLCMACNAGTHDLRWRFTEDRVNCCWECWDCFAKAVSSASVRAEMALNQVVL